MSLGNILGTTDPERKLLKLRWMKRILEELGFSGNHIKSPSVIIVTLSFSKRDSTLSSIHFTLCSVYKSIPYFSITLFVTPIYFLTAPGDTVKVRLPPQNGRLSCHEFPKRRVASFFATLAMHVPVRGIRLYDALHFTQRIFCLVKATRLPLMSLRK